jgi:DNA repair protein RadC
VLMKTSTNPERPRERLLARGIEAVGDRERIALVLRNGTSGKSALDIADQLRLQPSVVADAATRSTNASVVRNWRSRAFL